MNENIKEPKENKTLELSDEQREGFHEVKENFPEIKSIEDLPDEVIENAVNSKKPLLDEYLRYRLLQEKAVKEKLADMTKTEAAKVVGRVAGERAKAKGIEKVVFDRGGYLYTGRVKAVADGAREAGLNF